VASLYGRHLGRIALIASKEFQVAPVKGRHYGCEFRRLDVGWLGPAMLLDVLG
jgi:hypothetical protein